MARRIPKSTISKAAPPLYPPRRRYGANPQTNTPIITPSKPKAKSPSITNLHNNQSSLPVPVAKHDTVPPPAPPILTAESLLSGQLSPQTKRAYRSDLKAFFTYLGHPDAIDKPEAFLTVLRGVDRATAANYRDRLLAEGKAATTIARRMTALNIVFEILKEEEIITRNPLGRVRRPKVSREGKTHAFTQEQSEAILSQPDTSTPIGQRDRIILLLLFFCGLRISEVVKIAKEDFYMTSGHPMVFIHGKGRVDKSESVFIPPAIWPEIQAYIADKEGALFTAHSRNIHYNTGKPISSHRVYLLFKEYCRMAGIDAGTFTPHSTRATFITLCLSGGADVRSVMYAARHSDPSTTIRYDRQRLDMENHASQHLHIRVNQSSEE